MNHESLRMRFRSIAVAVAPLGLLTGYGLRPYVCDPRDPSVTAEALAGASTRWIWGHVIVCLGLALTMLSMLAIRSWLRAKGERFWSFSSVALVTTGATILVFLIGFDGLGGWATIDSGNSPEAFFASGREWERPLYTIGASLLGAGLLALGRAVVVAEALHGWRLPVVLVGLLAAVLIAAMPAGWSVYVIGAGAAIASWPIAATMWYEARKAP
jgi:hypothetical protein